MPVSIPSATPSADPGRPRACRWLRGPARCPVGWLFAPLAFAVGCVDVPDQSPMGGAPMEDAAPPDAGGMRDGLLADGRMPDGPLIDRDDPESPDLDAGEGMPDEVHIGGRPADAEPGPIEPPAAQRFAVPDPVRCPEGGALLPGLEMCVQLEPLPELPHGLRSPSAVALPDGRVLVAGGEAWPEQQPSAETWVLEDGEWRPGPPLVEPVSGAGAIVERGQAVFVGGLGGPEAGSTVQAVDPDGMARAAPMLDQPRIRDFSVHHLGEGRIIVVGGETLGAGIADVEEVRTPEQRVDAVIGQLAVARRGHAAAVDASGALWVLGGLDRRGQVRFAPEVLAPDAAEWDSAPGPAGWAMVGGAAASTGDSILFAGGVGADGRATARAGTYDHAAGEWRSVGPLNEAQEALILAPLGDAGAVLSLGPGAMEIYDPVEQGFRQLLVDQVALRSSPAVVAVHGRVVVVGGTSQGRHLARAYRVELLPAEPPGEPEDETEDEEQR